MAERQQPKTPSADIGSPESQIQRLAELNTELTSTVEGRESLEGAWKVERRLLRAMIDQVPDYLFVKDTRSRFIVANRAVAADLGLEPDEMIGKTDFELHPAESARQFYADEQAVVQTGKPMLDIDEFIVDADGRQKWLSTTKVPLRDENDQVIGIVGICRDVTEKKRAEAQIRFMALHDVLTGLPNRSMLMERLQGAIEQAKRNAGKVTVVFIDLDNFKLVNDSLGHGAGDALLKTVAERMIKCVRGSDMVVRLGGDEFVVLLGGQDERADPRLILHRLRSAIAEPVPVEGQLFRITSSIGVASYPQDGQDAETLLLNADVAMYQAKEQGRDAFQFYTPEMNAVARERRILQEGLRHAIAANQFTLHYQPQIDLRTGTIFAVEALVRWNHPELGLVAPSRFIPMAEESGLIVPLGDWVLHEACRQNKAWQDAGAPPVNVCVNVSARQFREKNWTSRVTHALAESGLEAKYLELEVTESMLMQDLELSMRKLSLLREAGIGIAIDDFGTGYSSLRLLDRLPVDTLKIDRSFVQNIADTPSALTLVSTVVSLARAFGMRTVAEGVETREQLRILREMKCDQAQGYLFGRPTAADAVPVAVARLSRGIK